MRAASHVASSCSGISATVGLQIGPALVLVGEDGSLLSMYVVRDEGAPLSLEITPYTGAAGPLNVLAGSPNAWPWLRWQAPLEGPFGNDPIDRLTMASVGAADDPESGPVGPLNVSYNPTGGDVQCETASLGAWPADDTLPPYRWAILAECSNPRGGVSYLLSEGAVLYTEFDLDAQRFSRLELVTSDPFTGTVEVWATPDPINPSETTYDAGANGGTPFVASAKVVRWTIPVPGAGPTASSDDRLLELSLVSPVPVVDCTV